jgi:primosomal protein N'
VLETVAEPPRGVTVRPIAGVHEPRIALTEELIALCRWIAGYYAASLGEVLGAAAPSVTARKSRARRDPARRSSVAGRRPAFS